MFCQENGQHRNRVKVEYEDDMEIAKMLREVLRTKEADSKQLAALQEKMDDLAHQINSSHIQTELSEVSLHPE